MLMTNEFVEELQGVTNKKQVYEFLVNLVDGLELDYFLLGLSFPSSISKSEFVTLDNYPTEWRECYNIKEIIQNDPIIHYCAKKHSPIFWGKVASPEGKGFNELLFPSYQSGFAFPLHGPLGHFGLLSLSTSSDRKNCEIILSEALTIVQIVLPYLQDALLAIKHEFDHQKTQLTMREIECLTWATEGKSAWEIAQILGCSERTITFHLNNATTKLECTNRYQAIAKAILTGVITPNL